MRPSSTLRGRLTAAAASKARRDTGRSDLGLALVRVIETWAPALFVRGIELEVEPVDPMTVGVDAEIVERIMAPLLDNAGRYARSRVVLSVAARDGAPVISVVDDGPGMNDAAQRIFGPGALGRDAGDGHATGLARARRLARAVGGDVTLAPAARRAGAEFHVRLPPERA